MTLTKFASMLFDFSAGQGAHSYSTTCIHPSRNSLAEQFTIVQSEFAAEDIGWVANLACKQLSDIPDLPEDLQDKSEQMDLDDLDLPPMMPLLRN